MNELKEINIENLIYEVRRKQAMLDRDVSVTKCNDNMLTHYDIGLPISSCNYNFADTFAKLLR